MVFPKSSYPLNSNEVNNYFNFFSNFLFHY
nr:MAG TPA: hypothetical protein [Caudoviricetes sp.]